ncbi:hypothetical protein TNCV_4144831 [Trichonephila clavipes]|nr:hypothetical protein TNCV_4144831 [Trichonephila clavipes]
MPLRLTAQLPHPFPLQSQYFFVDLSCRPPARSIVWIGFIGLVRSEIELAIPFVPNRDPPDTPQQSELGEVVHYHPSE